MSVSSGSPPVLRDSFGEAWIQAQALSDAAEGLTNIIQQLPESARALLLPFAKLAEDAAKLARVQVERQQTARAIRAWGGR